MLRLRPSFNHAASELVQEASGEDDAAGLSVVARYRAVSLDETACMILGSHKPRRPLPSRFLAQEGPRRKITRSMSF